MASDNQTPSPETGTGAVPDGSSTDSFIDETMVSFETIVSADGGALDLDSDDALIVVHADSTPVGSERHVIGPEIARGREQRQHGAARAVTAREEKCLRTAWRDLPGQQ